MINLSNKDIWWSYFARFLDIASGILILPIILHKLSVEEIGMYYLMLTIGSFVMLFDFGFAPQFGRNITYVLSGVKELKKEGIEVSRNGSEIDYRLLNAMIHTARYIYRRLSIVVLLTMLFFGSAYINIITDGFTNIENSIIIWLVFSGSTFFNIYFTYYASLLIGKGLIKETNKAKVYSRLTYIVLAGLFLFLGIGLLGVVLADLLAPFVKRHLSYNYFFTKELLKQTNQFKISVQEKIDLFKIIWHNSKKLGIVFVCTFITTKFGLFMAGLYLPLNEIASYGLMIQLVGFISGLSGTLFEIYQPMFSSLRVKGDNQALIKEFAFSMNVYYIIYFIGIFFLLVFGQMALRVISSNTLLPSLGIMSIYAFIILLEGNHSNYATLITTGNDIPFVVPALIGSVFIILGSYISLKFTNLGILGLIIIQGVTETAYDNWKWPLVVHKEFNISFKSLINIGFNESINRAKIYVNDKY